MASSELVSGREQADAGLDRPVPASAAARMDHDAGGAPVPAGLLSAPVLRRPANGGVRALALRQAQQGHGNRYAQRFAVQRQCACGGTCENCRRAVQRQAAADSPSLPPAVIPAGLGEPLDEATSAEMGARFGRDFSGVRVHRGGDAAASSHLLEADAYTTGRDIYFAAGKYEPGTHTGKRLLAHELTHVVQQSEGLAPESTVSMHGAGGLAVGHPNDPLERQAESSADRVMSGTAADVAPQGLGGLIQRQPAPGQTNQPAPVTASPDTVKTIVDAMRNDDKGAVVAALRNIPSVDAMKALRQAVFAQIQPYLERWLVSHRGSSGSTALTVLTVATGIAVPGAGVGAALALRKSNSRDGTVEEGLRRLWPALPLVDRLEIYNEGYRELEQAQIDTIRAASAAERAEANQESNRPRMDTIYAAMDLKEEYEARVLIDGSAAGKYTAAGKALDRASGGVFSNDPDVVYDAVLALAPSERRRFFDTNLIKLYHLLFSPQFKLLSTLAKGTEAQALIARLRLATEGRSDDMAAVQAVVDRAVALLAERRELRASLTAPGLSDQDRTTLEARLKELDDLDTLLQFQRGQGGELGSTSFMGLLSAARADSAAFGVDARRLAEFATDKRKYAYEAGKQKILLASGNVEALKAAIYSVHAPAVQPPPAGSAGATRAPGLAQWEEDVKLREEVLRDPDVVKVLDDLTPFQRRLVLNATTGDDFNEALSQLNELKNSARWGEFFDQVLTISRNDAWRSRFEATANDPFGAYANVFGEEREIMLAILRDHTIPLKAVLKYTGNVEILKNALRNLPETDRARLRLGWSLSRQPFIGPLSQEQDGALKAFQEFESQVRSSQTTLGSLDKAGFETVLAAGLGAEPTAQEVLSDEGRYRAAAIWDERVEARLALDRGISASFTETDETMDAAGREFAALWLRVKDQNKLSLLDFAALSTLYERFDTRAEEFSAASKAITDLAGTIAATVAGIVVVVATGGAATPAVIALAAAAGAGGGMITREAFGGDYYTALSSEGARAALLDSINGALAVVSGGLAARGAELVGLGGASLTQSAARAAGAVAEEATVSFGRKVAASAVEAAIDGMFSGAVSEGFAALTDDRTWRRGIMEGLVQVGKSALLGGLTGAAGGAVLGAAMPAVGRAASWVRRAAAGRALEETLVKAGVGDVLKAARTAAQRGDAEAVTRLAEQLEAHLGPDEAKLLRQQLRDQLTEVLGHPPGTAKAASEAQEKLLRESGTLEGGLSKEQLDAELDLVARSDPQPTREAGYVDEVDLGNGHSWRRREDGTWCRFSKKSLCGTEVPKAKPPSAADLERARIAKATQAAETKVQQAVGDIVTARETLKSYREVVERIRARSAAGQEFKFSALSKAEQEAIEQVYTNLEREQLDKLTLRNLDDVTTPPGVLPKDRPLKPEFELSQAYAQQERALLDLAESKRPLYEKVRAASPTERLRDRITGKAKGLDQVSGLAPPSGALDVDHIVPLKEIMEMPGFRDLPWADQVAIVNHEPNLRAVDSSANRSRGELSWADKSWSGRNIYTDEQLAKIIAEEAKQRVALQNEINQRLARLGRR